ncbi:hypothetical protein T4E_961 [Trichinella pseudospiralis]|uniref:Uncharacterized protein n=1 Tax=Trichinella pseudospiralis TaxID=6337 RepID=A0A0V0XEK2_TRIPS|nr:hypothetical protein T4E_961 [Trichinella pseudospiralis]
MHSKVLSFYIQFCRQLFWNDVLNGMKNLKIVNTSQSLYSTCMKSEMLLQKWCKSGEADFDNSKVHQALRFCKLFIFQHLMKINEWMNWNSRSVSVVWLFPDSSCSQNLTEKANDQLAGRRA